MGGIELTQRQKYRRSEHGRKMAVKYYHQNKEKTRVQKLARYYHPIPSICSIGGCREIGERHHPDYNKPKEILWLCRTHHAELHKRERGECSLCDRKNHARNMCKKHYNNWLRNKNAKSNRIACNS